MTSTRITHLQSTFGRQARDLREQAREHSVEGARAALTTFYHAFNERSLEVFNVVWAEEALISLNNPLGGVIRGIEDIRALYRGIFEGPACVWVELHDIVEYYTPDTAVFSGREHGEFSKAGVVVPLHIRTTRVFQYFGVDRGWRQVHHHGSIDDPEELALYQGAVRGKFEKSG